MKSYECRVMSRPHPQCETLHCASLVLPLSEAAIFQNPKSKVQSLDAALRSPGLLAKHYSPKAKLLVLDWTTDADLRQQIANRKSQIGNSHVIAHTRIPSGDGFASVSVIPHDAEAFARALYAELHRCDEAGAELIVVEALPATPEWRGIADRLTRAAAGDSKNLPSGRNTH